MSILLFNLLTEGFSHLAFPLTCHLFFTLLVVFTPSPPSYFPFISFFIFLPLWLCLRFPPLACFLTIAFIPPLLSFLHTSSIFHLPCPSPSLAGAQLPSPNIKQGQLSWQPLVVLMEWNWFICSCFPFKTIRNGLAGAFVSKYFWLRQSKSRSRDLCSVF